MELRSCSSFKAAIDLSFNPGLFGSWPTLHTTVTSFGGSTSGVLVLLYPSSSILESSAMPEPKIGATNSVGMVCVV